MWTAAGIVVAAAVFALVAVKIARMVLDYLRETAVDPDDAPQPLERDATEGDEAEVDTEQFVAMLREGPRNQELRDKNRWKEERRADGLDDEDVQAMLDSREPIVRL